MSVLPDVLRMKLETLLGERGPAANAAVRTKDLDAAINRAVKRAAGLSGGDSTVAMETAKRALELAQQALDSVDERADELALLEETRTIREEAEGIMPEVDAKLTDISYNIDEAMTEATAAAAAAASVQADHDAIVVGLTGTVADAIATAKAEVAALARVGLEGWLKDPTFSDWTSGNLTASNWSARNGTSAYAIKDGGAFGGGLHVSAPSGSSEVTVYATNVAGLVGADPSSDYVVLTVQVEFISGNLLGAMARVEWSNDGTTWTRGAAFGSALNYGRLDAYGMVIQPGVRQGVQTLWKRPSGVSGFIRAVFSAKQPAVTDAQEMIVHLFNVGPATQDDIDLGKAYVVAGATPASTVTVTGLAAAMAQTNAGLMSQVNGAVADLATNYYTKAGTESAIAGADLTLNSSFVTVKDAANTKGKVIYQADAPAVADRLPQNLWIDTTGGANTPKRWNGSAWVAVTDKAILDVAADLSVNYFTKADTNSAISAASTTLSASISTAQSTADGKGKVITQSAAPAVGDRLAQNLWIDTTSNNNTPKRWNGSAWVAVSDKAATDAAAAATSIAADLSNNYYTKAGTSTAIAAADLALNASFAGVKANVTAQGVAIASLNGNASASYALRVGAGGASAGLELVAFNSAASGGTASNVKINADYIDLVGKVRASFLLVSDFENLCHDPRFLYLQDHTGDVGRASAYTSSWAGYKTDRVMAMAAGITDTGLGERLFAPANIGILQGSFRAECYINLDGTVGNTAANIRIYIYNTAADGTRTYIRSVGSNVNTTAGVNLVSCQVDLTDPAENTLIYCYQVRSTNGAPTTAVARFNAPAMRRMNGGELQVDGSLKARHMAAEVIISNVAQLGTAVVSTAAIGNAAIVSAKIADAAITTAKIGDLQVDTLKIKNNAVTVPVYAVAANKTLPNATTGDVISATIARVAGFNTEISCTFDLEMPTQGNSPGYVRLEIYRGATLIETTLIDFSIEMMSGTTLNMGPFNVTKVDKNTSGGSTTYTVKAGRYDAGLWVVGLNNIDLRLQQYLR